MSPLARVVGFLVVLLMAACTLPIPSRAAEVRLEWTDVSSASNQASEYRVEELVGTTWTRIATVPRGSDVNATLAGFQAAHVVTRPPGSYTFRVKSWNIAGESTPSNTVNPVLLDAPPAPVGLIFTITVE